MKIKYRPEIDGLRAIAVMSVIVYHADLPFFKGGFLGVDIFFVISGYLISKILIKEQINSKTISIKWFYQRRIRRIIPALLTMIIFSFFFGLLFLSPSQLIELSWSSLSSISFISNYFFYLSDIQYEAIESFTKPLLHTWSLSVEEQFYIIFPVLIIFAFRYLKNPLFLFLPLFFLSLLISEIGSHNFLDLNFYSIHSRFWELLTGFFIAYFEIFKKNFFLYNSRITSTMGLIVIFISLIFVDDSYPHPSILTIIPVIGISLIILNNNKNSIANVILSSKFFVSVGLISYSLYLWHFPLFAFSRITEFTDGNLLNKISLILILFVLSILSYFFIEKIFRNKKLSFKKILIFLTMILLSIIILSIFAIKNNGLKERFPKIFHGLSEIKSIHMLVNSNDEKCLKIGKCTFNDLSKNKVYIVGDSHMAAISFDLKNKLLESNYQFTTLLGPGCFYFPEFIKANDKTCTNRINDWDRELQKVEDSIIIIGGRLPVYLSNRYFDNKEGGIEKNKSSVNKFTSNGKFKDLEKSFVNSVNLLSKKNKVFLIYPIPEVGWKVPEKLLKIFKKNKINGEKKITKKLFLSTSYDVYIDRTKKSFELFDSLKNENIIRIYPHELFCNTVIPNRCITHSINEIYYYDDNHLSLQGSNYLNIEIISKLNRYFND
ncbi:acyltransferase [Candidatus Pelagibacter sp.]|nr:acyltransferase [Candidatus Pelagibacter sp.]